MTGTGGCLSPSSTSNYLPLRGGTLSGTTKPDLGAGVNKSKKVMHTAIILKTGERVFKSC